MCPFFSDQNDAGIEPCGRVSVLHTCVAVHIYRRPQLDPDQKHLSSKRPAAHLRRGFHYTRLSESHGHRFELLFITAVNSTTVLCHVSLTVSDLVPGSVQGRWVGSTDGECGCCTCWRVSATVPSCSPVYLSCWTSSAQLSLTHDW